MKPLAQYLGICYLVILMGAILSNCGQRPCPCNMGKNHECVRR